MICITNQYFEELSIPVPNNIAEIIALCAKVSHTKTTSESKDISNPEEFVKKLISWGHMSPFEHVSASVKIITNRAIANELVRHRHCAFTQESTRYCNYYRRLTVIKPLWLKKVTHTDLFDHSDLTPEVKEYQEYMEHLEDIHQYYRKLIDYGVPQEQARGILPLDTATSLIMTANLREWISIFKLRCDKASHPQMVELMSKIRDEFVRRLPWLEEAV